MALRERNLARHSIKTSLPSESYVTMTMPAILGTFDMVAIYVASIFFIGNAALAASRGVISLLYLFVGSIAFFLPSVVATAQLGKFFPYEGSLYNWTCRALGPYWGFFAGVSYWLPNVLAIVGGAVGFVTYIQGINNGWLAEPWQQGLVIVGIILLTTVLGTQRLRTTQNVVNVVVVLTIGVIILVGAACFSTLLRHGSDISFTDPTAWMMRPQNYSLFGIIALLYLGTSVPMNMVGETSDRSVIKWHLMWGTLLVLGGYFLCTIALLVVRGPDLTNAAYPAYEVISMIDSVFGKILGTVATVSILSFYLISPLVHNYATSRLLFAASVDGRLPTFLGRLNKNRVPANAVRFQSLIALIFVVVIFFIAPSVTFLGKPTDLATQVYSVILASVTLIWALCTIFYFVDLFAVYLRDKTFFFAQCVVPPWLLWLSALIGTITCIVVVVDTLLYSWTPLIASSLWLIIIGSFAILAMGLTAIGSILATSQAAWENFGESTSTDAKR